jgi:translation initiation factor IF-2
MSTKDLLDRLQSGNAPKPSRAPEPKAVDTRSNETRVGAGVVRRRTAPTPEPPPPPPAPKTVIRRPAVRADEPAAPPPVAARPTVAPEAARPVVRPVAEAPREEPRVTEAPADAETPLAAPPVPVPAEIVAQAASPEAPHAPAEAEAAPAPVAAAPEAPEAPSAPAGEPSAPAAAAAPAEPPPPPPPPVESTMDRAVIVERPGGAASMSHATPSPRLRPASLPDRPILPGLGRAVVSLPAGYDPTDPTGARRRAREQAQQQPNRWGAGPGAAPGADRNRRPEPGAPSTDDRNNKKKGRREHAVSDMGGGRHRKVKSKLPPPPAQKVHRKVQIDGEITVANLAHDMGVKAAELIKLLMQMGQPATVNQRIDFDTATLLAQELGHEVFNVAFDESEHLIEAKAEEDLDLVSRPPVVTVMGHVDHGKTTLLDTIRKTKVAAGEAGGITQHIGAYQVMQGDRPITFLDTPGHAAFSAMRARGARATDIVILVVAADDGVMPQTVEAIRHAKAANVPVVVAVNKIDKPGISPERIRQGLMEHGLVPEDFGGDTIFVNVSALKGTGVSDLLDNVLVVAEVADFKANPKRHGEGVVLESRLEVGRGAVVTLLVQNGTLKQGDTVVIGTTWGRVRSMSDDSGKKIKEAGPSTPVEIFGLQDVPSAGDEFTVVASEKDARALAEHRAESARVAALSTRQKMTVEDLFKQGGADLPIQHIVLKADVGGTLEALKAALEGIQVEGTQLKVLHAAIGPVNESDVNLAAPDHALIIAFNAKADAKARQAADQYKVEIKRFDIIYEALDEVKRRMTGMLAPVYEERKVGEAEVRAVFTLPRGIIAGCMVLEGTITRNFVARVARAGKVVHESRISSLRRFKEDVKEVDKGFECGIGVQDFTDFKEGDTIAAYERFEVPRG